MGNGFGGGRSAGRGLRGGMGFGFRGSSPPWPYVGIGRGGLPRHAYFFGGASPVPYSPAAAPAFGVPPYVSRPTPEQELDFLRNQAEAIGKQLAQIEQRMGDLESEK